MLSLLKAILSQNYFMFQQKIYQPAQGISMGSPISSLTAEIFLQHYEDTYIKQLLDMKNIALYVRYVDDILVIHDTTKINLHTINTYMNKIHNIKLNPTYEEHNFIAYLDLIITRIHTKLEADIYIGNQQLQTQQFTFFLITPQNKKMAPSRFHITRIHSLPLNPDKKQTQWKIIQSIAKNNNFPQHLLLKLTRQILHKVNNKTPENTYDPTLYNNPEEYYLTRTLCEGLNIYIMSYYMLLHSSRHSGCSVRRNACANQDHLLPDPYLFNIHESPSPSFVNT